jgi:hypothetical protein
MKSVLFEMAWVGKANMQWEFAERHLGISTYIKMSSLGY